ncbi:MAG: hypothetical protein NC210_07830, partial [[Clostridium] fimetarium]|nr:hypothetical protein [[Clostridium] fimetarium]
MRFTTSCAVLACLCLGASAEILPSDPTMILGGSAVTILPSELTASGEGCFMIGEADGKVSVHDASFEKLRTLEAPSLPDVVMNREQRSKIIAYTEYYQGWGVMDNHQFQTIDEVRDYLRGRGIKWKAEVLDEKSGNGDILFVVSYLSDFLKPYFDDAAQWRPGFHAPVIPADYDLPYEVYRYYAPSEKKYLIEERWPTAKDSRTEFYTPWESFSVSQEVRPVSASYQTEQHSGDGANVAYGMINNIVTWSQTLFNDDDSFECLVPDYEIVPLKEREPQWVIDYLQYETRGDTLRVSGYSVYNDRGARLASLNLPSGYDVIGTPRIMSLKNKAYISIYASLDNDRYLLMYAIDRATGSLRSVAAPVRVAVSPTACDSGTPVNVTLGSASARP